MLTDARIKAAKPREKAYKIADERGMYLYVSPTGGKLWRLNYRFDGKEKTLALGQYPDVPLSAARDRRDDARKLIAAGTDPSAAKKEQRLQRRAAAEGTFEKVAREWFEKRRTLWVPRHQSTVLARLENDILPRIGKRPIAEITSREVLNDVLRRVEARGAHETARRIKHIVSAVFSYAIGEGFGVENDVTQPLRNSLAAVKSTPRAAVLDPRRIGQLLRVFDSYDGTLVVKCALQLGPLVFVRPGELRHAEWTEIDFERSEWTIPAFKMKRGRTHTVPLSTQAVAILRELQPVTGDGKYIFPSGRSASRPMSDNAVLAAFRRCGIPPEELSGHGWRATARTLIAENLEQLGLTGTMWESMAVAIIEHQLAHVVKDPNGEAYSRMQWLRERRQMMQAWADYLDGLKATPAIFTAAHAMRGTP